MNEKNTKSNKSRWVLPTMFFLTVIFGLMLVITSPNGTFSYFKTDIELKLLQILISCFAIFIIYGGAVTLILYTFGEGIKILSDREFQNSFYYLGFIFTLMSICCTVYFLSEFFAASKNLTDIQNDEEFRKKLQITLAENAVALITTIFGITVRNILVYAFPLQKQPELENALKRMSAASVHLSLRIEDITNNMKKMHEVFDTDKSKEIKDTWVELGTYFKKADEQIKEAVDTLSEGHNLNQQIIKMFQHNFTKLSQQLEHVFKEANKSTESLEAFSSETLKVMEQAEVVISQSTPDLILNLDRNIQMLNEALNKQVDTKLKEKKE